jgi:hypothetical protein
MIMNDKRHHLSGKKQLLGVDIGIEVAIEDVSECYIERPKNEGITIPARRNDIPSKHN